MSYFKSHPVIKPFHYQRSALAAFFRGSRTRGIRTQLIVMATGLGKTIVFAFLAGYFKSKGRRVLIVAHRDNLIDQAVEKMAVLNLKAVIEKADRKALPYVAMGSQIVVASVQSLKGRRLESWPRNTFDLIVIDEGHHYTLKSQYHQIVQHFENAAVVGVTATDRAKAGELGKVYQRKAYERNLVQGVAAGELARPFSVRGDVQVDLRGITTRGGDYDLGELEERIFAVIEPLALATRKEVGSRITIVFTPDIRTAQAFAKALNDLGVASKATWGSDPLRESTVQAFKDGEFQVLCNCSLFTEGFDHPPASAVVIARPTKSSTLMMQMVGRVTRKLAGKTDCMVLDFGWVVNDDNIQTVVDLFAAPDAKPADVQRARKLVESGEYRDPQEALDQAQRIREAKEAAELERAKQQANRKVRDREIAYQRIVGDPFGVNRVLGVVNFTSPTGTIPLPATPGTVAELKKLGVRNAAQLTEANAAEIRQRMAERDACGMSTWKQIQYLVSHAGYDHAAAADLSKREANQIIGPIVQQFKRYHKHG